MRNRLFSLLLALSLLPCAALGESLTLDEMNAAEDATPLSAAEAAQPVESAARADFIDRILALAETLYAKANGQPQRAQYSGDIYVCKNYTVHLFRETCGDFRMAEYPDVPLVIPNNQKKADCAPYVYGVGAHSMLFIADYDPETDSVHWADSNMKGKSVNGVRYAYVQYDAVKPIDWFVDAFCRKKYGATIYRLRDDIVYAE